VWSWSPPKWISGDWNCEATVARGKAWNGPSEARSVACGAPWTAAPADGGGAQARAAGVSADSCPGSPEGQGQTHRGYDTHRQRLGRDDHSSPRLGSGNKIHAGESPNTGEGGSQRGASLADQSRRLARFRGIPRARPAVLEYLLSAERELSEPRIVSVLSNLAKIRKRERREIGAAPPVFV